MGSKKSERLRIGGMSCVNCAERIEKGLRGAVGVIEVRVDYGVGVADIVYEADIISREDIVAIICGLDYQVLDGRGRGGWRVVGAIFIAAALYLLLSRFVPVGFGSGFPLAESGMGYGMLFLIGLATSVHCLAMCGGINLSQCIPQAARGAVAGRLSALRPGALYSLGRVISYTMVGALVGALGAIISFSGAMKGAVQLLAGVFMVVMGCNMLGVFPWLRKISPRLPRIFARQATAGRQGGKSPLYVGLLNGLMPCGPLQAMQLYALSTGSPLRGALAMLLFCLGTVPLTFSFGALSSLLSKKFTAKVMTAGAVLVIVMGFSMFSAGWGLTGISSPATSAVPAGNVASDKGAFTVTIENGAQLVHTTLLPNRYMPITVVAGIPVKWTIEAPAGNINGCNNAILIPEYDVEYAFSPGGNVVEFTPQKAGKFIYTCWMGMIKSSITVIEAEGGRPIIYDYVDAD